MVRRVGTWVLAALVVLGVTACQAPPQADAPTGVVVPATVIGKDPQQAKDELRALGFTKFKVEAIGGKAVVVEANWRVVSVTLMGQAVPVSTELVLGVDRPQPTTTTAAPATTTRTTTAPPPPPSSVEPPPLPEPEVTRPANPGSVYYKNCTDAKAKGAAPLHRGEPGYRKALDRDGDGVACER